MTSLEKFREVFSVNLYAPLAIIADAGYTAYSSSKASLIEATRALAFELGKFNIRVNTIAPDLTETTMGLGNKTVPDLTYIQKSIALRRF